MDRVAASTERLLTLPAAFTQATAMRRVRSTLLSSAIVTLRERGFYEAYLEKLSEERRQDILSIVAGVWIPIDVAMAHYAACDSLQMSTNDAIAIAIGAAVGHRIQATTLSTLTRLAAGVGLTPGTGLAIYDRLWSRIYDGGGFATDKVGPKDAGITMVHVPFARCAYFRASLRGVHVAGAELFTRKAYAREGRAVTPERSFALRLSWA